MLELKPKKELSEGAASVLKMLRKWVKRLEEHGDIELAVIVACPVSQKHSITNQAGAIEYSFVANWGLDDAKLALRRTLESRHEKSSGVEDLEGADRVCWNMSHGPACYDWISWLVLAEMRRRKAGAPGPLKIGFTMTDSDAERNKHEALRKAFYRGVIFPSMAFVGAEPDEDSNNSPEMREYTFKELVKWSKAGEEVVRLTPSPRAAAVIREQLDGKRPVTITLREVADKPMEFRNSNLAEWIKVAEHLEKQGERVIFIRDTGKADEPIDGFETCPLASRDIHIRLAVYEEAKCNLFVSNGPWTLALFGSRPWLMFVETSMVSPFFPETPQFWKEWHGIDPSKEEQAPWSLPTQRIIWKRDNADNIIAAWEELRPKLG